MLEGTKIGKYVVVRKLGAGAMADVYQVRHCETQRPFALKLLKSKLAVRENVVRRFEREAQILMEIDDPGIMKVHEADIHRDEPYFVMDLVQGCTLGGLLARRKQPHREGPPSAESPIGAEWLAVGTSEAWINTACRVARDVARALVVAHQNGVIHRDIKPENILLGLDGRVVVTDFGIAHVIDATRLTNSSDFVGTPNYAAPESIIGELGEVDHRSDVYSLGVTLFEMLTGTTPFNASSIDEHLARIASSDAPRLRSRIPQASPNLDAVCGSALEFRPQDRYSSAQRFLADLDRLLAGFPVGARRPSRLTRIFRWTRRNPWVASSIVVMLVCLAMLTNYSREVTRSRNESDSQKLIARAVAAKAEMDTARFAIRYGKWSDAHGALDRANELGYPDVVEIELGRIDVAFGEYRINDALAILNRLASLPDLDRHGARVQLLQAITSSATMLDPWAGADQIRTVLEQGGLQPADAAYAKAYLARDLVSMREALRESLRLDPFHRRSLIALEAVLILLGEFEDARDLGSRYLALSPSDPFATLQFVFLDVLEGNPSAARRRDAYHSLSQVHKNAIEVLIEFYEMYRDGNQNITLRVDHAWFEAGKTLLLASLKIPIAFGPLLRDPKLSGVKYQISLPPTIAECISESIKLTRLILARDSTDPELNRVLNSLMERMPCSGMFLLRAGISSSVGMYDDAERYLRLAATQKFCLPIDRIVALATCANYRNRLVKEPELPRAEEERIRHEFRESITRFVDIGKLGIGDFKRLLDLVREVGDSELEIAVISGWKVRGGLWPLPKG